MSLMVFIIVNKSQRNTKTNTALVFVSNLTSLLYGFPRSVFVQKHKVLNVFLLKQEKMYLVGPIFSTQIISSWCFSEFIL